MKEVVQWVSKTDLMINEEKIKVVVFGTKIN